MAKTKASIFTVLAILGTTANAITQAVADGKVEPEEYIELGTALFTSAGMTYDADKAAAYAGACADIRSAVEDGKLTLVEVASLAEKYGPLFGFDFDQTGVSVG